MIDPKKLEEWTRLAEAGPPAPWRVLGVSFYPGEQHKPRPPGVFDVQGETGEHADKVLAFVAAAREAVPALIAEVGAMLEVLRSLEWNGGDGMWAGAACPCCGRHDPTEDEKSPGHAPDCRLAALLRDPP